MNKNAAKIKKTQKHKLFPYAFIFFPHPSTCCHFTSKFKYRVLNPVHNSSQCIKYCVNCINNVHYSFETENIT